MNSSKLTPAQEAREVIETETRCHQAATLEPAFLVAMRYLPDHQKLCDSCFCLDAIIVSYLGQILQTSYAVQPSASCRVRLCQLAGLSPLTQYVKRGGFYRWWNTWSAYTGFTLQEDGTPTVMEQESSHPRPLQINNNCLLDLHSSYEKRLKPGLQEGKDFKLVFESTWHLLHGWYGGEPACMRRWVGGAHPWVEVYALQLIIRRSSDQKESQLFIPREVCTSSKPCYL